MLQEARTADASNPDGEKSADLRVADFCRCAKNDFMMLLHGAEKIQRVKFRGWTRLLAESETRHLELCSPFRMLTIHMTYDI